MDLTNRSGFPAEIFRTVIDEQRLAAAVVARVTYDVVGYALVPSAEQRWPVSGVPWESPYGLMESDEVFYRGGVDLFVFGQAWAPRGHVVPWMYVGLTVGEWQQLVRVTGDRVWLRAGGGLVPSEPVPFASLPLTNERSFGGCGRWDGLDVPYPDNPAGRGYYLDAEAAAGGYLPNVEFPDTAVAAWDDRPEPVGFGICPMHNGLRMRNSLALGASGRVDALRPTMFNAAFPRMIVPHAAPGTWVRLDGVHPDGPVAFRLVDPGLRVRLQFGHEVIVRAVSIDQIGVEPDRGQVFVTYRYPFRYVFHPLQRRSCELLLDTGVAEA